MDQRICSTTESSRYTNIVTMDTVYATPPQIVMWGGGEQRGENIGASETFLWQMVSHYVHMSCDLMFL